MWPEWVSKLADDKLFQSVAGLAPHREVAYGGRSAPRLAAGVRPEAVSRAMDFLMPTTVTKFTARLPAGTTVTAVAIRVTGTMAGTLAGTMAAAGGSAGVVRIPAITPKASLPPSGLVRLLGSGSRT